MRLDQLLVARGDFETRAQAQAAIKAGAVRVNGAPALKPSQTPPPDALIEAEAPHPWISRGGVKLAAAIDAFNIDPADLVCLDLGASTGGFTDVLLSHSARRVYAVDVGRDQLHPRIAAEERVVRLDGVNAKDLTADLIPEPIDLLVCDVSFISLLKAASRAMALVRPGGAMVALVKPQFEVGREHLGKGGIAEPTAAERAVGNVRAGLAGEPGWADRGLMESPIAGGDGNREWLVHLVRS
ncbi:MAG: TlyA family RNA methyltransferase [Pseudomonadota bacterium]